MAMTERRRQELNDGCRRDAEPRGFRPTSRRRTRIAGGAALAAAAIGGNVLVYTSIDDKTEVLQFVRNIRAGETVVGDDLRIVEVEVDPTVPVVAADEIGVGGQPVRAGVARGGYADLRSARAAGPARGRGAGVVAVEVRPAQSLPACSPAPGCSS